MTFTDGTGTISTEGYTAPDFTKDGKNYKFTGWKLGKYQDQMTTIRTEKDCDPSGTLTAALSDYPIETSGNSFIYVYAAYEAEEPAPAEHTITFSANGGTIDLTSALTADGRLASLPTPTWEGYTFTGWFTAPEGGEPVTADTVFDADTTIYAQWKVNETKPDSESTKPDSESTKPGSESTKPGSESTEPGSESTKPDSESTSQKENSTISGDSKKTDSAQKADSSSVSKTVAAQSVKTGDTAQPLLWAAVSVAAAAVLLAAVFRKKKRS